MKKAILLLFLFMVACSKPQSNRDKAILAIQQYVKSNFNDPNSYENIEYSKLDSAYEYPDTLDIQIENMRQAILESHQADSMEKFIETQLTDLNYSTPKKDTGVKEFKEIASEYQKKLDLLLATPKQKHYYISDKHRAKNKLGALELNTINYELDTTFKIIDTD